ncbi:MocR-like pyridoxine biosynthesis transcription factor PdxR [Paenibacillus sp. UNC451MF]|uniref:MocR-like pyridoxine biosynthesis transcription factor PdxR n=1 Tax=Paenibacillus sp. UNC451MF TaxID=1449063 RepID=UPI000491214B|nr:PLP-dependent aminotransferase family protein [Paenibacillus sp. UNC451MF]
MWFSIEKNTKVPMFRQVFEAFRGAILCGRLQSGHKLPSTRELAAELQVSRNVILEAYELLLAEGYITGRHGAGSYVAEGTYLLGYKPDISGQLKASVVPDNEIENGEDVISFRTGLPAVDLFPMKLWGSILQKVCADASTAQLGYGDSSGDPKLRSILADHLWRTRGVIAKPEQIIVTNGAVQALDLIVRGLLTAGDEVVVEEPSNVDLKIILSSTGAVLQQVPVDDLGLMTDRLPAKSSPKCIYVTPSHQFPLGGIMPIQRRIELVEYARRRDSYILEDDYDSEFRYDGAPVYSLQSLCTDRVIYIGTFSKVMFPSLRIGFMVVPEPLVQECKRLKRLTDYQTPSLDQLALARFMQEGHLNAHILRMKKLYRKRRELLIDALNKHVDEPFRICGRSAGLHLVVEFDSQLASNLNDIWREQGVIAMVISEKRLLLGYGHLSGEQIDEGIRRIGLSIKHSVGVF